MKLKRLFMKVSMVNHFIVLVLKEGNIITSTIIFYVSLCMVEMALISINQSNHSQVLMYYYK